MQSARAENLNLTVNDQSDLAKYIRQCEETKENYKLQGSVLNDCLAYKYDMQWYESPGGVILIGALAFFGGFLLGTYGQNH